MGTFDATEQSIETLSSEKVAYAIPPYQRAYVWQEEQNQQLWEDVRDCYENPGVNHFTGSLVLMGYKKDEYVIDKEVADLVQKGYTVFHVVDGQQRLTSLSIMLAALYDDMLKNPMLSNLSSDLDSEKSFINQRVANGFLTQVKNRSGNSKHRIPRILPVKSIYDIYESLVNDGYSEDSKGLYRIQKAYVIQRKNIRRFREEEVSPSKGTDNPDDLLNFYDNLLSAIADRMKFVRIICSESEDPFQVFESLNGTGLSLTGADRVKNKLMGLGSSENPPVAMSTIESHWRQIESLIGNSKSIESFLRSYLFIKVHRRVQKKEVYDIFVKTYLPEYGGVIDALDDLKDKAALYCTITKHKPYTNEDGITVDLSPKTKETLIGIQLNNPEQSIVPLLAIASKYGFGDEFDEISSKLLTLLVRHKVCQLGANALDTYFSDLCEKLDKSSPSEIIASIQLNCQPDTRFASEFAGMEIEGNDGKKRARYYLTRIENYLLNKSGASSLDSSVEYTLEHIIPQSFEVDDWFKDQPEIRERFKDDKDGRYAELFYSSAIGSIGNMCLLRRPENSAASNKCYKNKIKAYKENADETGKCASGSFALIKQLISNSIDGKTIVEDGCTFDSDSINTRATALAKMACDIWK